MRKMGRVCAGLTIASIAMLDLSGCGWLFGPEGYFRDRSEKYLKAEQTEAIKLPAGVQSEAVGQLFVIPPIAEPDVPLGSEFEVPRPDTNGSGTADNQVKIQKLADRRWVAVNAAPGEVWPRVLAFLEERNYPVSRSDAAAGDLETAPLHQQDGSGADRFRFHVEPGMRPNSAEVHVAVVGGSSDREVWMTGELAGYLAKEQPAQASLLAQAVVSSESKVSQMVSAGGEPCLVLRVDLARAWASVGAAVKHRGFSLDAARSEQRIYDVSYSAEVARSGADVYEPEEPGFFGKIGRALGFGRDNSRPEDSESLQVHLQEGGPDGVRVYVRDSNGKPLDRHKADTLLRTLRAHLA